MVQSRISNMSDTKINIEEALFEKRQEADLDNSQAVEPRALSSWHIPRPSLVGRSDRGSENEHDDGTWKHHAGSGSRGSTSSQSSNNSTHSAASGTLLLTAANLANLAAIHPPRVTMPKELDTASVASSTHFTVVNGLGRPTATQPKSWCARNQLTVLVCTMSFLFMLGLLAGILYMEIRARDKYN